MTDAIDVQAIRTPRHSWRLPFMTGLVAILDIGLIQAIFRDEMTIERAIVAHSEVVLALSALSFLLVRREALADLSRLILLLLSGPLGGPTLLAGMVAARMLPPLRSLEAIPGHEETTQPLSERLLDDIRQNRRRKQRPPNQAPMTWTIAFGTDRQRSAILGVVARRFTPEMRPALDMALRSPDAALRVQSASVHAKLRDEFARLAIDLAERQSRDAARGAEAGEIDTLLAETRRLVRSGFLDAGARARLDASLTDLELASDRSGDRRTYPGAASGASPNPETVGG